MSRSSSVVAVSGPSTPAAVRDTSLRKPGLYALAFLGVYLSYLVLRPFLVALTWAVMLAMICRGFQAKLATRMTPGRAATLTTIIVGLLIVAPAVVLVSTAVHEAPQVIERLKESSGSSPAQLQKAWDAVRAKSPVALPADPMDVVTNAAQRATAFLAPRASGIVSDFLGTLGTLGAALFALFFMLRDGDKMKRQLLDRLPFSEDQGEKLMSTTRDLVVASIGAGVIVAIAQGLIGGLSFWVVGIPAPAFWGVVMGFCSLLPVVGATLVWVPTAIGLLLSGAIGRGVALLVLGLFGISMADNVLRPLLLAGKTSVSGLVIFFGLLGGAAAFGFIGLVIGPIILVITSELFTNLRRPDLADGSVPSTDRMVANGP